MDGYEILRIQCGEDSRQTKRSESAAPPINSAKAGWPEVFTARYAGLNEAFKFPQVRRGETIVHLDTLVQRAQRLTGLRRTAFRSCEMSFREALRPRRVIDPKKRKYPQDDAAHDFLQRLNAMWRSESRDVICVVGLWLDCARRPILIPAETISRPRSHNLPPMKPSPLNLQRFPTPIGASLEILPETQNEEI